ncbi:signal recognition particle 14 kd protein [Anaeramoeba flamelloides]|uniref:Signal recognition particle 14 kDa protein n=1 Tax=Anaeramoeba flamelloides TaxID=1746091 RepID=A0AAV7Z8Q6_9EUKA|nr:signal recognition particle 14 kd protein [Anaeramoeba flamelloides]KAJ6240087.1 signal recognition particle 14 kd protein [Anaeramoeba flamelloides]
MLLTNDQFLLYLKKLFESNQKTGSVFVTLKRTNGQPPHKTNSTKKKKQTTNYRCLCRATDGKKKISTYIEHRNIVRFQIQYNTILQTNLKLVKKIVKKKKTKKSKFPRKSNIQKK